MEHTFILPTFICIGPGRAGTSWLYEVLLEHPEICMAKGIKETQFFNEYYSKGFKWYGAFFDECYKTKTRGEVSNRYIFDPNVAERINTTIPECKILICMRNPYERIQSVYSFKLREGVLNCSFEEALQQMPSLIEENRYYSLIKPYFDLFGKDKIFLIFFEKIKERPHELCQELFNFLGVDHNFVPSVMGKKINQAIAPRFPFAAPITKGVAKLMRSLGLYGPLTWAKRSDTLKSFLFKQYNYNEKNLMSSSAKALIDPVVLPELEKLETLLNQPLSTWIQKRGK